MTKRSTPTVVGKSASAAEAGEWTGPMRDVAPNSLNWGPGGPRPNSELVDAWVPGRGLLESWGHYYEAFFQPQRVTPWIKFKRMTTGVNIARRLWDEREAMRLDYEAIHGEDPEEWPARHPGVVLESARWVAHPACLGCQWLATAGSSMKLANWRDLATEIARQHENGVCDSKSTG